MIFYDDFLVIFRVFRTFSYADGIMYEVTIHEAMVFHDEIIKLIIKKRHKKVQ